MRETLSINIFSIHVSNLTPLITYEEILLKAMIHHLQYVGYTLNGPKHFK